MASHCVDCGIEKVNSRRDRCRPCASKRRWTPEYREKMKAIRKEVCSRPEYIEGLRERGKAQWTPEYREMMSEKFSQSWAETREKRVAAITEAINEPEVRARHLEALQKINAERDRWGPNNPNWRGGKSFEPYPAEFNQELKSAVKKEKCEVCGCEEHLQIHHIDYDKDNNDPDNLATLCARCHGRTNFNRSMWSSLLTERVGQ